MVPLKTLLLAVCLCPFAQAALPGTTVWEVRTTGSDSNGGGFVTAGSGTDYSQNDNKNAAACSNCGSSTLNLSTTDAVAVGTTTITSATANFTAAIVDNVIYLAGGTGTLTAGWYRVTTFTDVATIVVDRNVAAGTGISINIGGALLSLPQLFTNMVAYNSAYVKSGTYTVTSTINVTLNCFNNGTPTPFPSCSVNGYGATRGDGGTRPLITTATNSTNLFTFSGGNTAGWIWNHLSLSNTAATRGLGFLTANQAYVISFQDCIFDGFSEAIYGDASTTETIRELSVIGCEVKNSTASAGSNAAVRNSYGALIFGSYIHNNAANGFFRSSVNAQANPVILRYTVFASNGGHGLYIANGFGAYSFNYFNDVDHCVFYGNTGSGVYQGDPSVRVLMQNSIFDTNSRYGWEVNVAVENQLPYAVVNQNNAYYNNTLGATLAVSPGTLPVTLTADPFVSASTGNFTLNATAGGGKACMGVGFPGAILVGTGYADIGVLQSQASSGGGAHTCASAR